MKRKELYDMMVDINTYYPNFEVTEKKTITWQNILYFVKQEDFRKALNSYVKNEVYPPTIAGLLEYWKGNNYDKSADRPGD